MRNKNYLLLVGGQFLGVFADVALLAVILGQLTFLKHQGLITNSQLGAANAVYASLFFVPFVVLAPVAGFLNDRFAKNRWLVGANLIRLVGTAVAGLGAGHGPYWQGAGYLLVGVGACVYSPAKYGVLPEIVAREKLVKANGGLELGTLVAILAGNLGGARMIDRLPVPACYEVLLALYGASLALNALMDRTPEHPQARLNASVDEFFANFGQLMETPRLVRVLCGTCMFWMVGAVVKMNLQPWGLNVLRLENNQQIALLTLWMSLGIMVGAVLAGQLHKVGDLEWTRVYGWSLAVAVGLVGLVDLLQGAGFLTSRKLIIVMLAVAGTAAGLFLIPLNAALQNESHPDRLGKTIATQNFIDNVGMVAVGGVVFMGVRAGLTASGVFLCLSAFVALVVTALKPPRREAQAQADVWP